MPRMEDAISVIEVVNCCEDAAISCMEEVTVWVAAPICLMEAAVSAADAATWVVFAVTCSIDAATSLMDDTMPSADSDTEVACWAVSLREAEIWVACVA